MIRSLALLAALSLAFSASQARADFVGSFGLNANSPSILPAGSSLATATSFTIASMSSNGNTTNGFNGIGLATGTPFSGSTLTLGSPTGFTFTNATFGTFTQTTVAQLTAVGTTGGVVTSETFYILGNYSGGPVGTTPVPSSFTVAFTQNGGPTNSISASGTLSIPPSAVPEPASVAMLGLGLVALGGYGLRRRFAK